MARASKTRWCPVEPDSEEFRELAKLAPSRMPGPCIWFGASRGEHLDAAIGFNPTNGGGVWVHMLILKPTMDGKRAAYDLIKVFDWLYRDDNISFAVDLSNGAASQILYKAFPSAVRSAAIFTRIGSKAEAKT